MTINLETEIVATAFNTKTRVHSYTIRRDNKEWTVHVPDAEFAQFGPILGAQAATNKTRRRMYLARKLEAAMGGPHDTTA